FSGHVLRFKQILEELTPRSLVLIDELSTATDPQEGSALGRAVLEKVIDSGNSDLGALTIVTTHDPGLKMMAMADPRILNASMVFDGESFGPTYQLHVGVPGRSRAIETTERLGLSEEVVTKAKSYLTQSHVEFESLVQ